MEQVVDDDRIQMRERTRIAREVMPDAAFTAEVRAARDRAFDVWKDQTSKLEFGKALESWRQTVTNFEPVAAILLAIRPGAEETEGRLVIECR